MQVFGGFSLLKKYDFVSASLIFNTRRTSEMTVQVSTEYW